jgi:transmembrane sensor
MLEPRGLIERIGHVGAGIDPGLTNRDVERLVKGIHRKARRRLIRRVALGVAAAGLGVMVVARINIPSHPIGPGGATHATSPRVRTPVSIGSIRLADGSVATPLNAETQLKVLEDSARRVSIDLVRGHGRFEVVPAHARPFEVRAGDVTVHVVGTIFTVERVADRVGVVVERGAVRVRWALGEKEVSAGDSGWFPPLQIKSDPETQAVPRPPETSRLNRSPSMPIAGGDEVAEDLLAAADTARLAGRPGDAVLLLRRLLRGRGRDPRAPLAAFTLGRVLMMEMDRPREAAAAFAAARTLAPGGPFAEDALAREVEAWSKAGDRAAAGKRAREYLRVFPMGRRTNEVRTFSGIE